jgi:hypothetical protein
MNADRKAAVEAITQVIAGREETIIPKVEDAICAHIAEQDRLTCLTIVARSASGAVAETFAPRPPDLRYVQALTAFVMKKGFEGKTLDSALSDGTAAKVSEVFSSELATVSERISETLVPFLVRSEVFAAGLSDAIVLAYRGSIPAHLRQQVTTALTGKLKAVLAHQIDAAAIGSIKTGIGKVVGAAVATPVGVKLTALMLHTLATSLKPIIIKILASTALKAAIATKLKAIIIGSFLGAFVKFLAVKLGLSTAATFAWILLPIVIAWLAAEAYRFPGKLADSVSKAVATDMRAGFPQTSRSTAEMIVEMALTEAVAIVAREVVHDEEVSNLINEVMRESA